MIRPSDSSGVWMANTPSSERLLENMRGTLRREVGIGMETHEDIVRAAAAEAYDECDGYTGGVNLHRLAAQLLPDILTEQAKRQEPWPDITDCDRLDAAFTALNEAGILCRHHFMCCRGCGFHAIREMIDTERNRGRYIRGFAFYHRQRTEAAARGGALYLHHGSTADGEADLEVAQEVVHRLRDHGLDVDWPQDAEVTIKVKLDWKRRRPPQDTLGYGVVGSNSRTSGSSSDA